jgi:hypothetical protein
LDTAPAIDGVGELLELALLVELDEYGPAVGIHDLAAAEAVAAIGRASKTRIDATL